MTGRASVDRERPDFDPGAHTERLVRGMPHHWGEVTPRSGCGQDGDAEPAGQQGGTPGVISMLMGERDTNESTQLKAHDLGAPLDFPHTESCVDEQGDSFRFHDAAIAPRS
jgi:hypothetical protein